MHTAAHFHAHVQIEASCGALCFYGEQTENPAWPFQHFSHNSVILSFREEDLSEGMPLKSNISFREIFSAI